jgi:hypothetical protein
VVAFRFGGPADGQRQQLPVPLKLLGHQQPERRWARQRPNPFGRTGMRPAAPLAGVVDLWTKTVRDPDGTTRTVPSARHGVGIRWRANYVDDQSREHSKWTGRASWPVSRILFRVTR